MSLDLDSDASILSHSIVDGEMVSITLPDGHKVTTHKDTLSSLSGVMSWAKEVRAVWKEREDWAYQPKSSSVPSAPPAPKKVDPAEDPLEYAKQQLAAYSDMVAKYEADIKELTEKKQASYDKKIKWEKVVRTLENE